ncbi:MAG TPA: glycosyltransferase family 4 protein [Chitinophagaceae bacterium]|nr:glycosyltransferase family 4 protein [Chitinophagaceae bacterium]
MTVSKNPKRVLFYYPPNNKSIATETLCNEINKTGNKLIVLTQTPEGELHEELKRFEIEYHIKEYKYRLSLLNYFFHAVYLIRFCRKHRIDVVWSHLNPCNLPAVFAQYLIRARVVIFRHHFHASIKIDGFKSVNKNELKVDRIVSRLAKEIVVPSVEVYNGMIRYEKVKKEKIVIIPYVYNFERYRKPDLSEVENIKRQYKAGLLIIVASRMIKLKRHDLVLPVFKKLIEEGLPIKVLLLDHGEERGRLEKYVKDNLLEGSVFFLGFKKNIIDYLAAADLLVHPSYTEASSSLVKEFGLMKKPVIVCTGVGDFDQYIFNRRNGFVVHPPDEAKEFEEYIRFVFNNRQEARQIGSNLHESVLQLFSANPETIQLYLSKI